MDTAKAGRVALYAAVVVIIALTAGAFWLSYAHLAGVAGEYGLGSSAIRRWAWPATLDLFIVAGEVLMFRAALRQTVDPWAIILTVAGSGGSIALNVAGVGADARPLDYVVAGIPPTAALLAFGALMRQVHTMVTEDAAMDNPATLDDYVATVDTAVEELAKATDTPVKFLRPLTANTADTKAMAALLEDTTGQPSLKSLATEHIDAATHSGPATVTAKVDTAKHPAKTGGRTPEQIESVVSYLKATGQDVNGTTYAEHLGTISSRTGRRDLASIGITA